MKAPTYRCVAMRVFTRQITLSATKRCQVTCSQVVDSFAQVPHPGLTDVTATEIQVRRHVTGEKDVCTKHTYSKLFEKRKAALLNTQKQGQPAAISASEEMEKVAMNTIG